MILTRCHIYCMMSERPSEDDQYLALMQRIIEEMRGFLGAKAALKVARKAPLTIDADQNVQSYYGTGENALQILIEQYENYLGRTVADNRIRKAVNGTDHTKLLPDRLKP